MERLFVGEQPVASLPAGNRGLAYGDGLFETIRAYRGAMPWWDAHWARLQRGAERLGFDTPRESFVRDRALELLDGADAVLKLLVTRGDGGRGYAPSGAAEPVWVLSRHEPPAPPPPGGVTLRWCAMRMAVQPALAGIKHCNRLEQVLARAEWTDPAIHDALMLDPDGHVISATSANVFVLHGDGWLTPGLARCGIEGICRAWAIEATGAREARLDAADVASAEAVFVCNAVRGILPVARLGDRTWTPDPRVLALRRRLAAAHPAFALPEFP